MTTMSAEERWQVLDLIASYAECVDEGDVDGYVDNFVPNGVIEHSAGRCAGHDEIRPWVAGLLEVNRIGPKSNLRHVLGLPIIHGNSERCSARTYVIIPSYTGAGISIPLVGTYIDTCVKVDGRWLFEKRIIQMDLVASGRG